MSWNSGKNINTETRGMISYAFVFHCILLLLKVNDILRFSHLTGTEFP